jgi:hypothetical protein
LRVKFLIGHFFSVVVVLVVVLDEPPGVLDVVLSLGLVVEDELLPDGVLLVVVLLLDELDGDGLPASPFGPGAPGAPAGPAGPGVADGDTGTGVTVVFSHALSMNSPASIATTIEYLIVDSFW